MIEVFSLEAASLNSSVMSRGTTACETTRIVGGWTSFVGSMGI
jgi:hypothetical protein